MEEIEFVSEPDSLAESIRRKVEVFGGFDLEQPPRAFFRDPPDFDWDIEQEGVGEQRSGWTGWSESGSRELGK